jgi:hypothetical protein
MTAVAQDLFALEGADDVLVRGERDAAGHVVKLVVLYESGESDESPRTP